MKRNDDGYAGGFRSLMLLRTHSICSILPLLALLMVPTALRAVEFSARTAAAMTITSEDAKKHIGFLADDTLEGREAGSRGGRAAGVYIVDHLKKYGLLPAATPQTFYQSFNPNFNNILACFPGSDPELTNEYIIIGAHYDHVGYGTPTNSYGPLGKIHNGADDNASGVSGLLEIAEACSQLPQHPRRSILFAFWDGEEKGLLGSKNWIGQPTIPLKNVKLAVNADMIGRLRNEKVEVLAWRTGPGLRKLLVDQNAGSPMKLDFSWEMKANSDHWTFISHKIPTLMLFTGLHGDYHRPSDDLERINDGGMQDVARLLFSTIIEAADREALPKYREAGMQENLPQQKLADQPSPAPPGRLGIGWDVKQAEEGKIIVVALDAGSPAMKGKLKVGDTILSVGEKETNSVQSMRAAVLSAENPTTIVVDRPGEEEPLELTVELAGPPVRVGIFWRVDEAEPGAIILTHVIAGSAADLAGLKPLDRVYQVAGEDFASGEAFQKLISIAEGSVDLTVETQGQLKHAMLNLGE